MAQIQADDKCTNPECKSGKPIKVKGLGLCQSCYDSKRWADKQAAKQAAGLPVQKRQTKKVKLVAVAPNPTPVEEISTTADDYNPLLPAVESKGQTYLLDFRFEADLYKWLVLHEVTPEHIINLLRARMDDRLRLAA